MIKKKSKIWLKRVNFNNLPNSTFKIIIKNLKKSYSNLILQVLKILIKKYQKQFKIKN